MNEKITLQDIINLLCEKQGISPKDSETFVRTMFDVIEEALTNEKYVKIKGLGTFKLTEVNSRESVHVNTGERIEIQGHSKVSFTPDTSMKELINKPFSHFETVVLNEGVELEDTAVEEVEILETTDVSETTIVIEETTPPAPSEEVIPTEETPIEEPVIEVPAAEETIVEEIVVEEEPIIEQPIVEEPIVEEPIIEEPIIEEPIAEEPITQEPEPEAPVEESIEETKKEEERTVSIEEKEETHIPVVPQDKEKKEKSINRILWGVIVVLVLIILFGAYWMFLRSEETPEVKPVVPVQEEQMAEPAPVAEDKPQEETLKIVQFIELSEEELRKERVPSFADTLDYQIVGTQEEYTLQKGETIIRASVRFFGTKKFWPYIVKHNMDVLPDPDNIPAGIRIKIPKLVEKK